MPDIMLMYTDGLIERRGEDLEEGITRVAERLQAWQPGAPLGSLCDELIASLSTEPQLDDMCVLAVSRPGPDQAPRLNRCCPSTSWSGPLANCSF